MNMDNESKTRRYDVNKVSMTSLIAIQAQNNAIISLLVDIKIALDKSNAQDTRDTISNKISDSVKDLMKMYSEVVSEDA